MSIKEVTPSTDDTYLNENDAARILGLSARTLQKFRCVGGGPKFAKFGTKSVRYLRSEVLAWAGERAKGSTSEYEIAS